MKINRGGNDEIKKGIKDIKSTYYNIKNPDKLLVFLNDKLKPSEKAKNERGEVFTPLELVNEMLDKLPSEVWTNPNLKWLDPATGIGNFPVMVYLRLMDGLKYFELNPEKRRKHILENMLYMVELDKLNVYLLKKVFCENTYKLNIFEGSFIKNDKYYKKFYNPDIEFDIIIGNPPFNLPNGIGTGNSLYPQFIKQSLNLLIKNGYLLFVTPPTYRKPLSSTTNKSPYKDLFKLMTKQNQMIYLKIFNSIDGLKIFKVATRFDIYLIQKTPIYKKDRKSVV